MISTNYENNSTGGHWNLGDYLNQEPRNDFDGNASNQVAKKDDELNRLRLRYQFEGQEIPSSIEEEARHNQDIPRRNVSYENHTLG